MIETIGTMEGWDAIREAKRRAIECGEDFGFEFVSKSHKELRVVEHAHVRLRDTDCKDAEMKFAFWNDKMEPRVCWRRLITKMRIGDKWYKITWTK